MSSTLSMSIPDFLAVTPNIEIKCCDKCLYCLGPYALHEYKIGRHSQFYITCNTNTKSQYHISTWMNNVNEVPSDIRMAIPVVLYMGYDSIKEVVKNNIGVLSVISCYAKYHDYKNVVDIKI